MAWLVPYVINGAAHSAALFRRQAQRPATANTGIARPGDLKVTQLLPAAPGVRIAPGSLGLVSGFPSRDRESYGVENADEAFDLLGLTGTGSAARRDAVVIEVLDPNYLPVEHADVAPANYMSVYVIQGVAADAKTAADIPELVDKTAYVPAFINWPPNQTTVQDDYLEDARNMASSLSEIAFRTADLTAIQYLSSTTAYPAGGQTFPLELGVDDRMVDIPVGATHAIVSFTLGSVRIPAASGANGTFWIQIGSNTHPQVVRSRQGSFDADETGGVTREPWIKGAQMKIPPEMWGTRQSFILRARLAAALAQAKQPYVNSTSSVVLTVQFVQAPI